MGRFGALATGDPRARRYRKYLILFLLPVTIAVLASGAISVYSFQEGKWALTSVQHERALAAASWIEEQIRQIEGTLTYAARPPAKASDFELRRIELIQLLRQQREVTDIVQLDATGRETIAISRLGMDIIASGKDRSQEPAYLNVKPAKSWFSPVYFRNVRQSYMTIAIRSPDGDPVIVAEVNLGFIREFVSSIRIGDQGKVYVVDAHGNLIADSDIDKPLRNIDITDISSVIAVAAEQNPNVSAIVSTNLAGTRVLSSFARIESLQWHVFVEQPITKVYEKLNASIVHIGLLLLTGVVISVFGARALARHTVR